MWRPLAVHSEGNLDVGPASCSLNRELDAGQLPGLRTLPWGVSSMEITRRGSGFGGSIHTFSLVLVLLVWVGAIFWVGL